MDTITRRYHFEAAHFLPKVRDDHRCKRMHGHNYEMEVTVYGPIDAVGFIIDFWDLDAVVQPILARVDHYTLNDIEGLENPTAEYIARWFFENIRDAIPYYLKVDLRNVRIYETKDCWADHSA